MRTGATYDAGYHHVRWVVFAVGLIACGVAVPDFPPWGALVALGMFAPVLTLIAALVSRLTRRTRRFVPDEWLEDLTSTADAPPSVRGVSVVPYRARSSVAVALADRVVFADTPAPLSDASGPRTATSTFRYCVGRRAFPVLALSCSAALWCVLWAMDKFPSYFWWIVLPVLPLVAGVAILGVLGAGAYVQVSAAGLLLGASSCRVNRRGSRSRRLRKQVLVRWDEVLAMRSSGERLRILSRQGCEYILLPPRLLAHPFGLLVAEREQTFLHIVAAYRRWGFAPPGPERAAS